MAIVSRRGKGLAHYRFEGPETLARRVVHTNVNTSAIARAANDGRVAAGTDGIGANVAVAVSGPSITRLHGPVPLPAHAPPILQNCSLAQEWRPA